MLRSNSEGCVREPVLLEGITLQQFSSRMRDAALPTTYPSLPDNLIYCYTVNQARENHGIGKGR
jgi:hypothetical protein